MDGSNFEKELKELINRYSLENVSNTPDYILAAYLNSCLTAFNTATNRKVFHSMGIVDNGIPNEYFSVSRQGMQINKSKCDPAIICESCTKEFTDLEGMRQGNGEKWFCSECWRDLSPVYKK